MSPSPFRSLGAFEAGRGQYQLLPFRFMRWHDSSVLLTNECGEYEFVATDTFGDLTSHRLSPAHPTYQNLKSKHFLNDTDSSVPLELLA